MTNENAIKLLKELYQNLKFNDNMLFGQAISILCDNTKNLDKIKEELIKTIAEFDVDIPSEDLTIITSRQEGFIAGLKAALDIFNLYDTTPE